MSSDKLYKLAIAINTLTNNLDKKIDLGNNIRIGDKFSDILIRVNDEKYTFVQIKLVDNIKDNSIDSNDALEVRNILSKSDLNLQSCFLSFLRIKDQLKSRNVKNAIQKLIVFTNADLNHNQFKKEIGTLTKLRHRNEYIVNTDENAESYKITEASIVSLTNMKENLKCDLQTLAEEIEKYVINTNHQDPMDLGSDCFRYYHTALFNENVMEVREEVQRNQKLRFGKLTTNFVAGKDLSDRAQDLRAILMKRLSKNDKNTQDNKLQENMAKAEWKLSDDFGLTESEDMIFLPNYEISNKEVKDFFGVLEIRIKQHVKDVLKNIKNEEIRNRLLEYYDTDSKLVVFLINEVFQDWENDETTQEKWVLNSNRLDLIKELQFNVSKPQALHTTLKHVKYIEDVIKQYNLYFLDDFSFKENIFIGHKQLVIRTASNILSSIKMVEYLKKMDLSNYIFIDLESLLAKGEIIKLTEAFQDVNCNLCIISCKALKESDAIEELFSKISYIMQSKNQVNKQIVFITSSPDDFIKMNGFKEYRDIDIGIEHLVDSSKILELEVTIQNLRMPVGDLYKLLGPEVIDWLISKIDVGCKTSEMNYLEGAYSELVEEVDMEAFVFELLLEKLKSTYIVSDIPGTLKASRLIKEMGVSEEATRDRIYNKIELFEQNSSRSLNTKIYVTSEQFKVKEFKEVCKNNPETKIYWINLKIGDKSKLILSQVYNPKFYIKGQRFNNEVIIKKDIKEQFASSQLTERFFIFGINKKQMKNWLQIENEEEVQFEANCNKLNIQFGHCSNCIHLTVDRLNVSFQGLDEQNLDETVHLLKFEQGQLIWCKTYGLLKNLSKYRSKHYKNTKPLLNEDDIIEEIRDKKAVIIAGEPGIGKSTCLVKLYTSKYKLESGREDSIISSHWVIRVNLKDHLQSIRNMDIGNNKPILETKVVEFLTQVDKSLNGDIAKTLLGIALTHKDFGIPLLIVFDGFDEILDKEDRHKVISLLKHLKYKTLAKCWITTRLHYEKVLENELSTFSVRLEAMDTEIVRAYIKTYYRDHLSLILSREEFTRIFNDNGEAVNTGVLHEYTEAFLNKVYEIFKSDVSWFIGTPLQLYLMLEGSVRYFKEWISNYNGQNPDFSYLGNDIWEVYGKFVERKYDTYMTKREINENVKQILEKTVFDDFHRDLAKSLILETEIKESFEGLKDIVISAGVIRSDGENVEFIHPTFQEYFAANLFYLWIEKWTKERQYKLTNVQKKAYLFEDILSKPYYQVIRAFLNVKLLSESFGDERLQEEYYDEKILLLAIKERNAGIVRFLLHNFRSANVDNTVPNGLKDMPFKSAALSGNLDMLKLLISYSVKIEVLEVFPLLLHDAARSGNLEMVRYLIQKGAKVLLKDSLGETVLFKTVGQPANFEMINFFLDNGVIINSQDNSGSTVLHKAVVDPGNIELVKYLVQKKANVNAEDLFGETVLCKAAAQPGNSEMIKFLVQNGVNVRSPETKSNIALDIAIKNGDLDIVEVLVLSGVDVNASDLAGESVIFNAVASPSHFEILKYLVDKGANVNVRDKNEGSLIHRAVTQPGNFETVKYLVEKDVDINLLNSKGEIALEIAVDYGDLEIVKYLMENGTYTDKKDEVIICRAAARPGNLELVKLFIEKDVNVNSIGCDGEICLITAVKYGDFEIVKLLVENGADFNAIDKNGKSVLCAAVARRNFDMVELLVDHLADITDSTSALYIAARLNDMKIVKFLVQSGLKVAKANDGILILRIAARVNNLEMLEFFLECNAIDHFDETYTLLLHDAIENSSLEIVKYLVEKGANVDAEDESGASIIYKAVGHTDACELLDAKDLDILPHTDNAEHNKLEIVKLLLRKKVKIKNVNDAIILLKRAVEFSKLDILKVLVEHCVNIELIRKAPSEVLLDGIKSGNLDLVKVLVGNIARLLYRSYSDYF